jgi:hypothetical protein
VKEKIPINQGRSGELLIAGIVEAAKTCKVPCAHGLTSKCSACIGDILKG